MFVSGAAVSPGLGELHGVDVPKAALRIGLGDGAGGGVCSRRAQTAGSGVGLWLGGGVG